MYKGGRPKDPVWALFDPSPADGKRSCKSCSTLVSAKADRLRAHITRCPASSKGLGVAVDAVPSVQVPTKPEPTPVMAAPPAVQPIKVQSSIKSHIVATTAADNEYLDQVVAEFFIGCNIPFNVIDHHLLYQPL